MPIFSVKGRNDKPVVACRRKTEQTTHNNLISMKRIIILFVATLISITGIARIKAPVVDIKGNLNDYDYFYVVPTGGITSTSFASYSGAVVPTGIVYSAAAGGTNSVVPSDLITGFLMKYGYNIIHSITPENADKTLVISYGYTGKRYVSAFSYASGVIIQMRDASTQELVASFETEGLGENETDEISQALYDALYMFQYNKSPKVEVEIFKTTRSTVYLDLKNATPNPISHVTLQLTYYHSGEVVYEQITDADVKMNSGEYMYPYVKRDKQARNKDYTISVKVVSYDSP